MKTHEVSYRSIREYEIEFNQTNRIWNKLDEIIDLINSEF